MGGLDKSQPWHHDVIGRASTCAARPSARPADVKAKRSHTYKRGDPGAVELALRAYGESKVSVMAGAPGFSRSVASGESWVLFMLLTAFTRDGGAEGGGTMAPLEACLRPSSLD